MSKPAENHPWKVTFQNKAKLAEARKEAQRRYRAQYYQDHKDEYVLRNQNAYLRRRAQAVAA
jgi:hypothetical protein